MVMINNAGILFLAVSLTFPCAYAGMNYDIPDLLIKSKKKRENAIRSLKQPKDVKIKQVGKKFAIYFLTCFYGASPFSLNFKLIYKDKIRRKTSISARWNF